MSDFSSHGVGAAACAHAAVVRAVSAAAIERVLIESLIISFSRTVLLVVLNKPRTPFSRQYDGSFRRSTHLKTFRFPAAGFATIFRFQSRTGVSRNTP